MPATTASKNVLFIGTAGWNIPPKYSEIIGQGSSHIERYARRLNAVEINSSFYRPHRRATYVRWASSTPEDFRFAVKVPKSISHDQHLFGCESLIQRFVEESSGLGSKLGAYLLQLPPTLPFELKTVSDFLLRFREASTVPLVIEPRHGSWFDARVDRWFFDHELSRVAADPAQFLNAETPGGFTKLAYYRLHGSPRMYYSNYDMSTIAQIIERLRASTNKESVCWCIFDNTAAGAALGNALTVQSLF